MIKSPPSLLLSRPNNPISLSLSYRTFSPDISQTSLPFSGLHCCAFPHPGNWKYQKGTFCVLMQRFLSLLYWTSYSVYSRNKDLSERLWISSKDTTAPERGNISVIPVTPSLIIFLYFCTSYLLNQDKIHRSFPSDKQDYCFHAIVKCIHFFSWDSKPFISCSSLILYRSRAELFLDNYLCSFWLGQPLITLVDLTTLFAPWG